MAQLLFESLAFARVDEDTDGADDLARRVSSRRRRDVDLNRRTVLPKPFGLSAKGFAGQDPIEVASCFHARAKGIRLANRLFRPPAEELLGAWIPERDEARAPDGDNGKRSRLDQRLVLLESLGELVLTALLDAHDQSHPQENGGDHERAGGEEHHGIPVSYTHLTLPTKRIV